MGKDEPMAHLFDYIKQQEGSKWKSYEFHLGSVKMTGSRILSHQTPRELRLTDNCPISAHPLGQSDVGDSTQTDDESGGDGYVSDGTEAYEGEVSYKCISK